MLIDPFKKYEQDLKLIERQLKEIFASDALLLAVIGEHIVGGGGKRMRPLFLLMSSDLACYRGEKRFLLASIVEAIHTASLLHDDVVDGADVRRGKQAAHRIWGNQVVILVGDFLYSNALRLAVLQKNQKIMEALSGATTMMTEGEILQLNSIADVTITEERYLRIISAKTGALISAACRIGGILGGVSPEQEDALGNFGMKTGIVFQMVDDMLDYRADEKGLGKQLGKDLQEGKVTLPLIRLLNAASDTEKQEVKEITCNNASGKGSLKRVLTLFEKYNVIEESFKIARRLSEEAKSELAVFPDSPERNMLIAMPDYVLERKR